MYKDTSENASGRGRIIDVKRAMTSLSQPRLSEHITGMYFLITLTYTIALIAKYANSNGGLRVAVHVIEVSTKIHARS
jgi:hypothetical protein